MRFETLVQIYIQLQSLKSYKAKANFLHHYKEDLATIADFLQINIPYFSYRSTCNLLGSKGEFAAKFPFNALNPDITVEEIKKILCTLKSRVSSIDDKLDIINSLRKNISCEGAFLVHDCLTKRWRHGLGSRTWDSILTQSTKIKWGTFVRPVLLKTIKRFPKGDDFICEPHYNGLRVQLHSNPLSCIAFRGNGNLLNLNWCLEQTVILDGVLVGVQDNVVVPLTDVKHSILFATDILMLNGVNLMDKSLIERKKCLTALSLPRYIIPVRGREFDPTNNTWDAIVLKRRDGLYIAGKCLWYKKINKPLT
jgi:hypothetical protein